jgi:hypothetical protein
MKQMFRDAGGADAPSDFRVLMSRSRSSLDYFRAILDSSDRETARLP